MITLLPFLEVVHVFFYKNRVYPEEKKNILIPLSVNSHLMTSALQQIYFHVLLTYPTHPNSKAPALFTMT